MSSTGHEWLTTEEFAANFDGFMTLFDLSNADLASRLYVSREVVRQWRNGNCMPSQANMDGITQLHGNFMIVPEVVVPFYIENLNRLMAIHGFDRDTLIRADLAVPINTVHYFDAKEIARYIYKRHAIFYTALDLLAVLPLRRWAKREAIPPTRAKALFEEKLLTGLIETPYCTLVPAKLTAPEESKRMVSLSRKRPRWGIKGLSTFHFRLDNIMFEKDISNNELAAALNVNVITVSHWRTGERTPEEAKMVTIARICRCKVADLMFETQIEIDDLDEVA